MPTPQLMKGNASLPTPQLMQGSTSMPTPQLMKGNASMVLDLAVPVSSTSLAAVSEYE